MATNNSINQTEPTIPNLDIEQQPPITTKEDHEIEAADYTSRAQWLRAAILGANDGLLSTSSLMMGIGAVRKDAKTMILTGIAGMLAGASSMAIGEFVSVKSQYDTEMAQIKRESGPGRGGRDVVMISDSEVEERKRKLPSPIKAAVASAVTFAVGAMVPLLGSAFVRNYKVRLGVMVAVVSLALVGFGMLSAVLGKLPVVKPSIRVLIGGWLAMGITFGVIKLIGSSGI